MPSVGLPKHEYDALRRKVPPGRLWINLLVLGADAVLVTLAVVLWSIGWIGYVGSQLILCVVYFHMFALLHECGHGAVGGSSRWQILIGLITSVFCFLPYYPWKYIHAEHHTWTGNLDRDPTLRLVKSYDPRSRIRNALLNFFWVSWLPLAGLLQHVVFWMYPFRLLADREVSWSRKRNCILSLLVTFGGLAVCLNVLSNIVDVMGVWLSLVLYLAMVELVNFPHHLDTHLFEDDPEGTKLAVWNQPTTTRSCYYPFPLSEVLFLNFNFHAEHHVFPRAPWWHLRLLRRSLRARSSVYHECVGVGWNIRNRCRPLSEVAIPARRLVRQGVS